MLLFGITGYLFLDDDSPSPGMPMIGGVGILFHPTRFAVSVVLWALSMTFIVWLFRLLTGKEKANRQ